MRKFLALPFKLAGYTLFVLMLFVTVIAVAIEGDDE